MHTQNEISMNLASQQQLNIKYQSTFLFLLIFKIS